MGKNPGREGAGSGSKQLRLRVRYWDDEAEASGFTAEVSPHGAFIECRKIRPVGTRLHLEVTTDDGPFQAECEVTRVQRVPSGAAAVIMGGMHVRIISWSEVAGIDDRPETGDPGDIRIMLTEPDKLASRFESELSSGGMFLRLDPPPDNGSELSLSLVLPPPHGIFETKARVVLVSENPVGVGLQFNDAEALRTRLAAIIASGTDASQSSLETSELMGIGSRFRLQITSRGQPIAAECIVQRLELLGPDPEGPVLSLLGEATEQFPPPPAHQPAPRNAIAPEPPPPAETPPAKQAIALAPPPPEPVEAPKPSRPIAATAPPAEPESASAPGAPTAPEPDVEPMPAPARESEPEPEPSSKQEPAENHQPATEAIALPSSPEDIGPATAMRPPASPGLMTTVMPNVTPASETDTSEAISISVPAPPPAAPVSPAAAASAPASAASAPAPVESTERAPAPAPGMSETPDVTDHDKAKVAEAVAEFMSEGGSGEASVESSSEAPAPAAPTSEGGLFLDLRDPEIFRRVYETDIARGGIFVSTSVTARLQDRVIVQLLIPEPHSYLDVEGVVVHCVEEPPGLGVQLVEGDDVVRQLARMYGLDLPQ